MNIQSYDRTLDAFTHHCYAPIPKELVALALALSNPLSQQPLSPFLTIKAQRASSTPKLVHSKLHKKLRKAMRLATLSTPSQVCLMDTHPRDTILKMVHPAPTTTGAPFH